MGKLGVREKSLIHQTPLQKTTPIAIPGFGTGFVPFGAEPDEPEQGVPGGTYNFGQSTIVNPSAGTLWQYRAKTTATSGYPGDGYILWDNATQTSAANLIFAHITDDGLDIDLLLATVASGNTLIIQDANDSLNFQKWTVSGAPTNTNPGTSTSYWTIPVTLVSSGGTGTTGFPNNHQIIVFRPGAGGGSTTTNVTNNYIITADPVDDPEPSAAPIANFGGVPNSGLAVMAAHTVKMNNTGSSAAPTDVTPDAGNLQSTYYAGSTSGTSTYTATLSPVPTGYVTGMQYVVTITNTNTAAGPTMNFNSLGAKNLQVNGVAVAANQLQANATYQMIYDGTNLQVGNQPVGTPTNPFLDIRYGVFEQDDLVAGNPATGVVGTRTSINASGTAAGSGGLTNVSGHLGVYSLGTGSTSSGACAANGGAQATTGTGGTLFMGNGILELHHLFITDANLSDGTNRYFLFAGINNNSTVGSLTNDIAFFYRDNVNSGTSGIICHVAGVQQTIAAGSVTIAASTAYHLRFVFNAAYTSVDMYIKVGTGAEAFDVTYNGSFPASTNAMAPQVQIVKSVGGTSRAMLYDGWQYTYTLTTVR